VLPALRCDAVVVTCKDFRIQRYLDEWLRDSIGYGNFDRVSLAGGVKNWDVISGAIDLAVQLHDVHRVILINHENCGGYGHESTPERHAADLRAARANVLGKYPGRTVLLYYVLLDGTFVRID
jgi:carbonic anhydrase